MEAARESIRLSCELHLLADYFHPVSSSILPSMGKQISHEPLYEEYMTTDGCAPRDEILLIVCG
jgi:hypothetical protein